MSLMTLIKGEFKPFLNSIITQISLCSEVEEERSGNARAVSAADRDYVFSIDMSFIFGTTFSYIENNKEQ